MAISKAVINHAAENGYKFYIQGCGYRALVEITDLDNKHIGWTSNRSALALNSINALINQKRLDAKTDAAIATEVIEIIADLLPPVANEEVYQELQPVVDQWELDRAERIASQGELTADDFRSTYTPRDTFGDDAFALSARYGCGALI